MAKRESSCVALAPTEVESRKVRKAPAESSLVHHGVSKSDSRCTADEIARDHSSNAASVRRSHRRTRGAMATQAKPGPQSGSESQMP